MQIKYSEHIINRLKLRNIDYNLPKFIFEQSGERYYDLETGHMVASMGVVLYGKAREVMVAYIQEHDAIVLLTIHPLKEGQKENRIKAGRWRRLP